MKICMRIAFLGASFLFSTFPALAQNKATHNPTWWAKFQILSQNGSSPGGGPTLSSAVGANVDVSNECGPQSETFIAINPRKSSQLAAGSNEIFRLPMRGYFSGDDGASWGGVDLPLPPAIGTNGTDFGSDPTLAFDSSNNVFYGYIVVFFGAAFNTPSHGVSINGTELAVARSTDGGKTWPQVTFFEFSSGENHFNDKPMITADQNAGSPFRDSVYIGWDAAVGGSSSGGIRLARSRDQGLSFTTTRIDNPSGPGNAIGVTVTTGPQGQVYAAWNDIAANTITFNSSFDGGATWGTPVVIAAKRIPFDIGIPAEFSRRALVYPACDVDRSSSPHRGRITCSWMDLTPDGLDTDIYASVSDNQGATWSPRSRVAESLGGVDRFNQWLATDPVTGVVNVSFYDTRNDTTGGKFETDIFLSQGDGVTFAPSLRVTDAKSNEHDCNGLFPCPSINYGNQQGDYEGVAAFGGVVHPIWTDSRRNTERAGDPTCGRGRGIMEEVFTATVK
jgi:hypothetical protein